MIWLEQIDRALCIVDFAVKWIVACVLLLMTSVLFFNSIARTFLNESFVGGPALGRLSMIWLCFLGSYLLVRTNAHVTIDIGARMVSDRGYRWLSVVIGLVGTMTMTYLGWLGTVFTMKRFAFGQMDPMLEIPTGFFYLPLPIGGFLMAIAFLFGTVKALMGAVERPKNIGPVD